MECCAIIQKYSLDKELIKKCNEALLEEGTKKLESFDVISKFNLLNKNLQIQMINNPELLQHVAMLLLSGVEVDRLESLLKKISIEKLMCYSIEKTKSVLQDENIPSNWLDVYLEYYTDDNLTKDQRELLWNGLNNYFKCHRGGERKLIAEQRMLLYTNLVSSKILLNLTNYDDCLEYIAVNPAVMSVLELIAIVSNSKIDDEDFLQLCENPKEIEEFLKWSIQFFTKEEFDDFCPVWLGNHALLYDLKKLKSKVEAGKCQEAHKMVQNRTSYVAFFYNVAGLEGWKGADMEPLMIFAITHKKKAFLSLVRNNTTLFESLPYNSVLFMESFYRRIVNINTMNRRNLFMCKSMTGYPESVLKILSARATCTFEEVEILYGQPEVYAELYVALCIPKVDDRLKVMREIVNKKCLQSGMNVSLLAEKLSLQPLSKWMQESFSHIKGIDAVVSMLLLQCYDKLQHLIPDMETVGEVRYLAQNAEEWYEAESMTAVRQKVIERNSDWLGLQERFRFTSDFILENRERIEKFIYDDGAHIIWTYYKQHTQREEELRRLVSAELMGRFRELKYYQDDLAKEIDFPITPSIKAKWMENLAESEGSLSVWETDELIPVMQIGEIPCHTCLSFVDGKYSECLLSCHDTNKKVLYLSYNKKIVMRAAIRLTKGCYETFESKMKNTAKLEFADLCVQSSDENTKPTKRERLVLFLEHPYTSGLSEEMIVPAMILMIEMMRKKAEKLGAILVASMAYKCCKPKGMVCSMFSMYISKSKAGMQYLDSLGGSQCVDNEGEYKNNKLLVSI